MHTIKEKSVILTGCSSGIGKATAVLLKENGWRVFATARNQKDVDQLVQEDFESCQLDMENSSSIRDAVDFVLSKTGGKLYALINNAGLQVLSAIEDLTREELRMQFETNIFGMQELTNLIIPVLRKQGYGRIINVSSLAGRIFVPYAGAYCASKFALEALFDALRMELEGTNIFVSLIEAGPGIKQTNFNKNAVEKLCKKDISTSCHWQAYKNIENNIRRFISNENSNTGKSGLTSQTIAMAIKNVLESKSPRQRYFLKLKWYLFWAAMGFLPRAAIDNMVRRYIRNIWRQSDRL